MSDTIEWHQVYDRPTMFTAGVAVGDAYKSGATARSGGSGSGGRTGSRQRPKLILASAGEETAKQVLEGMYERAQREAWLSGDGGACVPAEG